MKWAKIASHEARFFVFWKKLTSNLEDFIN